MTFRIFLISFLFLFALESNFAQVTDDETIDNTVIDSKAKERNKLKEKKNFFKVDNIFVGTTFSLILGNYVFIDVSPYGGYLFGKYLGLGIGATYVYYGNIISGASDHIYGGRVFANLRPFPDIKGVSGLYAHVEGEYLDHSVGARREGVPALNLGLGYNTAFDKGFAFMAELLINPLWFGQIKQGILPVYSSPWQYRIGIYYAF